MAVATPTRKPSKFNKCVGKTVKDELKKKGVSHSRENIRKIFKKAVKDCK